MGLTMQKELKIEARKYLEHKWVYLCSKNWNPSCGKKLYVKRNIQAVINNIIENSYYTTTRFVKNS